MDCLVLRTGLPDGAGLDESRWTLLGHPGARTASPCSPWGGGSSPAGPVAGNNPAGGFICLLCKRSGRVEPTLQLLPRVAGCPPGGPLPLGR